MVLKYPKQDWYKWLFITMNADFGMECLPGKNIVHIMQSVKIE